MWHLALSWFYLYMAQGTSLWCSFEPYVNASRFSKDGQKSRVKNQESRIESRILFLSSKWKTNNLTEEVKLSLFETTLKRLSVGTQTGGMFRQLSLTRSDLLLKCILTYQEVA
jgi:hypothetical protein